MVDDDFVRAQLAIQTMAQPRAQTRALFMPSPKQADGELHCFPRSKTFRWLLGVPLGRWIGIASLTSGLSRLLR